MDADELFDGSVPDPFPLYGDLKGRSVFVTGGGSGIGAYFVSAFAMQGAKVGFLSLTESIAHSLCDKIETKTGNRPFYRCCDIRDVKSMKLVMSEFAEVAGPISVLVNNAARDTRHTVETMDIEAWDESINVNLRPYFFAAQAVVAGMVRNGSGTIINVGSNSANLGLAGYPAYVTAKAGIGGMTKALAREFGPKGVRVNGITPGWVMTDRQKKLWVTEEALSECIDLQAIKTTISGIDIANTALFLASKYSAMITGQSIIVDGGRF